MSDVTHGVPVISDTPDFAAMWGLAARFDLAAVIGEHLGRALEGVSGPATVACFDNWTARIAVDAVAGQPVADIRLWFADPTDELRERADARQVTVDDTVADRSTVVVAPRLDGRGGSLGALLSTLCATCDDGSTLIWSMSCCWPKQVAVTRSLLDVAGFDERATERVGAAAPLMPGWFVSSHTRTSVRHENE